MLSQPVLHTRSGREPAFNIGREVGVEVSPAEFDREAWATPAKLVADVERRLAS